MLGFACNSHKQIEKTYSKFINSKVTNRTYDLNNPYKKWNFIKIDVQKCYDNININTIIDSLKQRFRECLGYENVFTILKYSSIKHDVDGIHLTRKLQYATLKHRLQDKAFLNGVGDFWDYMNSNKSKKDDNIYVPIGLHKKDINAYMLENDLHTCFDNVIINIHNNLFLRMNGILHGSICSRILVDLHLGSLENTLFTYNPNNEAASMLLDHSKDLIIRMVDDYLMISDDNKRLEEIHEHLSARIKVNKEKTVKIQWQKPIQTPNTIEYPEPNDLEMIEQVDELNLLSNYNQKYITWNGLNFDVYTLDIYLNYDKYFGTDLSTRISKFNKTKHSFYSFNLKLMRLFDLTVSNLILSLNVNRLQAIIRNIVDILALSCIRYQLIYHTMPKSIQTNVTLQLKLINNLCFYLNNKLNKQKLIQELDEYFYNKLYLIKFLCYKTYSIIFKHFNQNKYSRLIFKLNKLLVKLFDGGDDFKQVIKCYSNIIELELNELIEQQIRKFEKCQLKR